MKLRQMLCGLFFLLWLSGIACAAQTLPSADAVPPLRPTVNDSTTHMPMSMADMVKQATLQSSDRHTIEPLADGSARIPSPLQSITAHATPAGITVTSLNKEKPGEFTIRTAAIGRSNSAPEPVQSGSVTVTKDLVRIIHQQVSEELTTSAEGIRQDFMITSAPLGNGALILELAFQGSTLRTAGDKILLDLPGGRELLYHRLQVADSSGKILPARFEIQDAGHLRIVVADAGATYPVRIDPTITDSNWVSIVGPFVENFNHYVYAMAWDGTNLYAGGWFKTAGGVDANYIAKWNGSSWSPLGTGMDSYVYALACDGNNLYAGGHFTSAGGISANYIAKWNGSIWSPLGGGMDQDVKTMAIDGTNLYVGGAFTTAGGVSANHVAKWNGISWSSLGTGMDFSVNALAWDSKNLYAGGDFTTAGGVNANCVAKWNGSSWSPLGAGLGDYVTWFGRYSSVNVLVWDGRSLYAGGIFSLDGGIGASHIAKWDGISWSSADISSGVSGEVHALAWDGNNLYAEGGLTNASGGNANYVAKWNGSSWSSLGASSGMDGAVYSLLWDGTNLYAGGSFRVINGVNANSVAKWDGITWSPLGTGMDSSVNALAWDGKNLYAGGDFTTAGGVSAYHIAKWNGSNWSSLGSGVNSAVESLVWGDTNLYVGGYFTSAGGVSANNIAKWNGISWSPLGGGVDGYYVKALAWDGENLYAGGHFTTAGGVSVNNIAKWNGSSWSPLGTGMSSDFTSSVGALAWDGTNLYAGGDFTTAGGVSANNIAKWNGSSWSPLGNGMDGSVYVLAWGGSNLYAGGAGIATWNGSSWSSLGAGLGPYAFALAHGGTNVYAGGTFTTAGDRPARVAYVKVEYMVNYDSAGGSSVANQQISVNGKATRPNAPSKTGYVFAGWYRDAGLKTLFDFSTPISTDITLYARWTLTSNPVFNLAVATSGKTGSITSSPAGISCGSGTANQCASSFVKGTKVTLTATGVNSTFTRWNGSYSGSTNPFSITIDEDKAVTATFDIGKPADMLPATNSVTIPSTTFQALKMTPGGQPAMIIGHYADTSLKYWERRPNGEWLIENVTDMSYNISSPPLSIPWSGLFFTPGGTPLVLTHSGDIYSRIDGIWSVRQTTGLRPFFVAPMADAVMGADGSLHTLSGGFWGDVMEYGYLPADGTVWEQSTIGIYADGNYFHQASQPRFMAMAVDSNNKVHAVYTPKFKDDPVPGGADVHSELWYLTNKNGTWATSKVYGPAAGTYGDAGLGASIAIRPDGKPAIASIYIARASTGSSFAENLLLHEQNNDGTWSSSTVASASDGYAAGDGARGTGFAPHLLYDTLGRPHITFTDFASQHFDGGQDEFGGDLRHAWKNGTNWVFTTVFRQTDPIRNQFFWPNMALVGGKVVMLGIVSYEDIGPAPYYQVLSRSVGVSFSEFTPAGLTSGSISVAATGTGTGTVTSAPYGISCGTACTGTFLADAEVSLTATAAAGSIFTGWTGCTSVAGNICTVTVNGSKSVTVAFAPAYAHLTATIASSSTGAGTVTSAPQGTNPVGISCTTGTCSTTYTPGQTITLTATPDAFSSFGGWSGDCLGSGTENCGLTMNSDKTVSALFNLVPKAVVGTKGYRSLQDAFDAATTVNNAVIKVVGGNQGGFDTNSKNITVTIAGGYDSSFSAVTSETILQDVILRSGTTCLKGIAIR